MHVLFEERQQFRQAWLWVLMVATGLPVMAIVAVASYRDVARGRAFGSEPLTDAGLIALNLLVAGLLLGSWALLWFARMTVTVTADEVAIVFRPFHPGRGRRIALAEIVEAKARQYEPLHEYGGWGLRFGSHGRAYNVSGDRGVQLVLSDGRRILIGSQRSVELEKAIASARGRQTESR